MISVLIVEDEVLELNALKNGIDYATLGMQIVGTACDGINALTLLEEKRPDILITDIVIPGGSGLELLRQAKELRSDTYVIIISGHQRFDYAQFSIMYGVERFLTKPLQQKQLQDLLYDISIKVQQRNRKQFEEELFADEMKANLPLLRDMFVRSLTEGVITEDTSKRLAYYHINLKDESLSAIILLPEDVSDVSMLSLRHSVTDFLEGEQVGYCLTSLTCTQSSALCVVFGCKEIEDSIALSDFVDRLRIAVHTVSGFPVTIGLGSVGNGWRDIPLCVATAKQALEYRFYLGMGQTISFQDISAKKYIGSPHLIRQLFPAILSADEEGNVIAIEQLCKKLYDNGSICGLSPQRIRIIFTELLTKIILLRTESVLGGLEQDAVFELYTKMLSATTLEEMIEIIKHELLSAKKSKDNYIIGREAWLVQKMKEYIEQHYDENFTIETIARHVYISSGYATRLFRKYMGMSINNYVTQVRMGVAAKLLKDPSISVGEVAFKTGYSSLAYFSSVFRKEYNYTPREWRDIHANSTEK